jgi:hypothetical protein
MTAVGKKMGDIEIDKERDREKVAEANSLFQGSYSAKDTRYGGKHSRQIATAAYL